VYSIDGDTGLSTIQIAYVPAFAFVLAEFFILVQNKGVASKGKINDFRMIYNFTINSLA
jgi:hypothetical protein